MRTGVADAYKMGVAVATGEIAGQPRHSIEPKVKAPFVAAINERLLKGKKIYFAYVRRKEQRFSEEKVYCWSESKWIQVKDFYEGKLGGMEEKKSGCIRTTKATQMPDP